MNPFIRTRHSNHAHTSAGRLNAIIITLLAQRCRYHRLLFLKASNHVVNLLVRAARVHANRKRQHRCSTRVEFLSQLDNSYDGLSNWNERVTPKT